MGKSIHTQAYADFLALLRELREDQGLMQTDLAERLERPQSYISKCENGDRRLDVIELRDWCGALGVPFSAFVKKLEKRLRGR